jgi:hypothetical protein
MTKKDDVKDMTAAETKTSKFKIDKESADQFFDDWAFNRNIDTDYDAMDEDDQKQAKKFKRIFVNNIRRGNLAFDDKDYVLYTVSEEESPLCGETITFGKRSGVDMAQSDKRKSKEYNMRMYATLASISKTNTGVSVSTPNISNMKGNDLAFMEALFILLMD